MPKSIGTFHISAGDTRNLGIDYTRDLWDGETLSTLDIPDVTGVTVTGESINVATFSAVDRTVAIGAGGLFTVQTPTAGTYTLTATATTTTSETIVVDFDLSVE